MKERTRRYYEELVARAVETLRSKLDEVLDFRELGRTAGLSPLHFHRIFRGVVGETPAELHRRLRLERAALALASTTHPVVRIALEAGYDTHESFTRAFAAAFGAAPSDFRTRVKSNPTSWGAATASSLAATSGIHFSQTGADAAIRFNTEPSTMNVQVKNMPAKRVIAAAHRGPYTAISGTFARLDTLVSNAKLGAEECTELVAIYYDDAETVPAAELRADAGVVVAERVAVPDGLHEVDIAGGLYACTVHRGPYEHLGDVWARFAGGWLVESGYRARSEPMYERYVNTPGNAAPEDLLTELYLALEPRS